MNEHISKQFDMELEKIRTQVSQMGGLVEHQLSSAMNGLISGDTDAIENVILEDQRINRMEVELDEACTSIIAKRQPAASDLRMIMTVIKTITDLERIGDEAKKIAKAARRLHSNNLGYTPRIELRFTTNQALEMLRKALDSFARIDASAAADIMRQDKEIDAAFKASMRQLITFMMEDPRTITESLDLLFIAKALERVGDHSKNISEYVVYMVYGRDIRHIGGADAVERQLAQP